MKVTKCRMCKVKYATVCCKNDHKCLSPDCRPAVTLYQSDWRKLIKSDMKIKCIEAALADYDKALLSRQVLLLIIMHAIRESRAMSVKTLAKVKAMKKADDLKRLEGKVGK